MPGASRCSPCCRRTSSDLRVVFSPGADAKRERNERDDLELAVSPSLLRELSAALRTPPDQGATELPSLPNFRVRI